MDELSKAISSVVLQVGYKLLKHKQNEAVKEFVSGRDTFVSLPTDSGKSLCYLLSMLGLLCVLLFSKSLRWMVQHCSMHIAMAVYMPGLLTHNVTRKIK